jgi:hypothetical protein
MGLPSSPAVPRASYLHDSQHFRSRSNQVMSPSAQLHPIYTLGDCHTHFTAGTIFAPSHPIDLGHAPASLHLCHLCACTIYSSYRYRTAKLQCDVGVINLTTIWETMHPAQAEHCPFSDADASRTLSGVPRPASSASSLVHMCTRVQDSNFAGTIHQQQQHHQ